MNPALETGWENLLSWCPSSKFLALRMFSGATVNFSAVKWQEFMSASMLLADSESAMAKVQYAPARDTLAEFRSMRLLDLPTELSSMPSHIYSEIAKSRFNAPLCDAATLPTATDTYLPEFHAAWKALNKHVKPKLCSG
jgi:hypothetical protein